jgi:hypothetical protein
MTSIADWEYALTRKLLKTAQHFVALPGVPPLPAELDQWPSGNPAWNTTLLPELLDLAKGYEDEIIQKTSRLAEPFFPTTDPQQLRESMRNDLHYRLSLFTPEKVPVFFYQLSGPDGKTTWLDRKRLIAMNEWANQHPGVYHDWRLPMLVPASALEGAAGLTEPWPWIRARPILPNWVLPPPAAEILINNRHSNELDSTLPHEYMHAIHPPMDPLDHMSLGKTERLGEILAIGALMTLLPHQAERRHVEPNSPLESILAGHDFASQVVQNSWYLDSLLDPSNQKYLPEEWLSRYKQRAMDPAEHYFRQRTDPWWNTMDAERRYTVRNSGAGSNLTNDAQTLTKALAYVVAYDRLKQKFPDLSKVTYADLLNTLRDMRNNRETKPLFDLVYFGPSSPQDVYKAIQPIVEKHPELKESPYVREITKLLGNSDLFAYISERDKKKQSESAGPVAEKSSETTKGTSQRNQAASVSDKASSKKDESSAQSKDGKSSGKDGKTS